MSGREYPDRPVCGVGVVCFKDDQVLLYEENCGMWIQAVVVETFANRHRRAAEDAESG